MSNVILMLAMAELALLIWAARRWVAEPANIALLLLLFILVPVVIDATTVGLGRRVGFGPTLEMLNRIRFSWFVFSMPLMWPICVAILGNAGFAWAQQRWLVVALIALATVIGGYQAAQAWQNEFHPACVFDIQRYVFQVPAGQECMGSQAGDGTFGLPIVVPLGSLAVAVTGVVLWWKRGWPWLALVCVLLFVVIGLPQSDITTLLSYPVDGLLTATLVMTAARFSLTETARARRQRAE